MAITKVTRNLLSTGIDDQSNATAITIDSSENVGIGTTSPARALEVHSSSSPVLESVASSTNNSSLRLRGSTSSGHYWDVQHVHGDNDLTFGWSGSEKVRITDTGNVGIGITSPAAPLHVVGSSLIGVNDFGSYDKDDANLLISNGNNGTSILLHDGSGAYHSSLIKYDTNVLSLGLNNSNSENSILTSSALNITSTGVGIGTASPAYALDIQKAVSGGNQGIRFIESSDGGDSPAHFIGYRSRGTNLSSPTAIQANNAMTEFGMGAHDGSNYAVGSKIQAFANQNWTSSAHGTYIKFSTTSDNSTTVSERMRIDSSGRLMVNQTSVSAASAGVKMQVTSDILTRGQYSGFFWENRSGITIAGQTGWGGWYSTGTSVHSLYSDGSNIVSINRSSGAYTALSDRNKKKDFEDSTVGLAEVMQLQPKKFRMLDDADDAPKKLGFVAQDVENVIPEAYFEDTNEDASGVENTFIGLTDRPIIAALTKAIQEQQTIIEDLKTRIETLENA